MGAHSAGRRVRAPGRHHRINQVLEVLVVLGLVAAATFAGWTSFTPAAAPPGSVLNQPVHEAVPSRPPDRPVPPVPAALLSSDTPTPTPAKKAPVTKPTRTARTCS